ncbi:hypothetical protein GH733_014755 [Mirounga leonina]|nr:hypothetical protein GH733_014755 [Mirounga leonina]
MGSVSDQQFAGGCSKAPEEAPDAAWDFLSMTILTGVMLDPLSMSVHQTKLHMEGFQSLKEGEAVDFNFKKSGKCLEAI